MTELGSARYRTLPETLSGLASDPPLLATAAEPARDVLPVLVSRDWKRLESKVAAAQVATDPLTRQSRLHGVRRAAKRVRYGLEPLTALYGRRARRLLKATIDIQTVLGDQHDAVVVLRNLRELSYRASESGVNAFTLGALYSQEHARAARRSAEFERVWARAARPKLRHWLS
jgi:CHAD domain-containing protein